MESELTTEQAKKRQDYEHAGYRQTGFMDGLVYMVKTEQYKGQLFKSMPILIHPDGDATYGPKLQPVGNSNL